MYSLPPWPLLFFLSPNPLLISLSSWTEMLTIFTYSVGNHTIAVVKTHEEYDSLRLSLRNVIDQVNSLIAKGSVNVHGTDVDLDFFLGGDYKVFIDCTFNEFHLNFLCVNWVCNSRPSSHVIIFSNWFTYTSSFLFLSFFSWQWAWKVLIQTIHVSGAIFTPMRGKSTVKRNFVRLWSFMKSQMLSTASSHTIESCDKYINIFYYSFLIACMFCV